MPLWSSPQRDYSEHAPLSTRDDDDEEVPALPLSSYSAATPSRSSYSDNPENGGYDDEDPGFGEGDFYHNGSGGGGRNINPYSSNQQQRLPHNNYRTGLICAYLKHFLTCCGSTRMKRCFLCLFYMVLMVTIMVCAASVGYIIARDGNYQNNNEQGNVNVGNTNNEAVVAVDTNSGGGLPTTTVNKQKPQIINTATKQKLPPPPLNLHEICSDWITESGRQKCQSECNKADCCSLPLSNKNSCWEEQVEECATYRAACMALELHSDDDTQTTGSGSGSDSSGVIGSKTILYAPPSNLSVLCSATALATPGGFDNCANVCRPSRCCYPDQFDCNLADDRYCEDYEDLCASVAESWRGSGHAVATTPSSTSSSSAVTSTATSSRAPTIANEVMKACNAANLNPPDDCIEACKPGACCYVSSSYLPIEQLFDQFYGASNNPMHAVASCASSVGFCQQYGSCEHFNHMKDVAGWNSEEVNYVVDVSTPCKAEHIAQFGALQCSNVCQPAHCCFSGEYACDDVQLGHLKCEDYSDCQVLYPTKKVSTEELLEVAKHIDKACSASSLKTIGGRAECQDVCSDHSCCFDENGCMNDQDQNCVAYAGCEPYHNVPTGGGQVSIINDNNNAGDNIGSDVDMDEFVTALDETCSEENLKTINGIYKCHNKCQSHLCCFASDDDQAQSDCSNQRPTACSVYEPCKRLVNPIDGIVPVKSLEPADIEKIVFDACYFGADPLKVTEEMVQKCHGVCAPRLCCFSDYLLQSSCRATVGDDECELYSLCEQLVTDDGVEVGNAIDLQKNESDVGHLCTSKVDEDSDLYDACYGLCLEKRSCCFDRPGYSCYEMEKEWCDEYKACERTDLKFSGGTVSNSDVGDSGENNASPSTPEMIEKNVYDACYFDDDESRVTQDLVTNCHNVCKSRYCCFDSYKLESSCRAAVGEEECERFGLCEQMITADGGVVKNFVELDLQEFNDDDFDYTSTSQEMIEKDVYDACYFDTDESRVTQDLVTKCNNVCQHRYCCFDSYKLESSCRATVGEEECELFALCEQMITADGGVVKNFIELDLQEFNDDGASDSNSASGPGSIVQYSDNGNGADTFGSQLEDACSESSLKTLDGLQTCHSKCQAHRCCFTTDPRLADQNCSGLIPSGCSAYEPCKRLITPPTGTYPVTSQAALSTREEIEKRVYDACYFGDDPTKVTEELVTKCHGVCAQRLCCFNDYKLQSSCRATVGDDECQLYSLCDQLVTANGVASDALEVEEKEFGVNELCIDKAAIDTTFFSACKETCQTRSCCFESNPGYSCYEIEKAWCDEYKACEVIGLNFQGKR